jgi:MFS family permease
MTEDRHVRRLMIFFATVYVVEGIGQGRVGIVYQPINYYLKEIGWTPLEVAAYLSLFNFAWVIKPAYGLLSDFVPLFGLRRKSYLILSSILAAASYAWVARLSAPAEFAPLLVLTSYAMAMASTLCGALLAENGQKTGLSSAFVNQQWLWFYIAVMASSFVGGELVQHLSALGSLQVAAAIAAVAPVAMLLATLYLLDEEKTPINRVEMLRTLKGTVAALTSKRLYVVAAFLFLYTFAPGFGTPLYYYMTDGLKFSQSYIGVLGAIASAGWIAGALVHRWFLRSMSTRHQLYLSIAIGTLSAASFLSLSGEVSAAVVNFANGVALMIGTISTLTLAAEYCPSRAEGFAFAGLMSIMNLADVFSSNMGAFLYDTVFDSHMAPLIVVSAASTAICVILVPLLRLPR